MFRVLVTGGRDFKDWLRVFDALDAIDKKRRIDVIIHGCAAGADECAEKWSWSRKRHVMRFPAKWNEHGKSAGPIRNGLMLAASRPDLVVAFPGGRGTADMVKRAEDAGLPLEKPYG